MTNNYEQLVTAVWPFKPTNNYEALVTALWLASHAPTDEQFTRVIELVEELAAGMSEDEVERAKAEAAGEDA